VIDANSAQRRAVRAASETLTEKVQVHVNTMKKTGQ
jgi:hypothetical protein